MKKLNKKGFTLVELLAVIVVLALIMTLTVPSVLSSMNSARQSSFILYAGKMIESAESRYQSELLLGNPSSCYELSKLNDNASTQYTGRIVVDNANTNNPVFKIQMYDNSYQIGISSSKLGDKEGGVTYNEIEKIKGQLNKDTSLNGKPNPVPKLNCTEDGKVPTTDGKDTTTDGKGTTE